MLQGKGGTGNVLVELNKKFAFHTPEEGGEVKLQKKEKKSLVQTELG